MFVNIWAEPRGQAWSYPAAYDLVLRLRTTDRAWISTRTGSVTRRQPAGCATACPSKSCPSCLGHSSVTTTSAVYGHLTVEDARAALEKAGWLTGREVTW